jgi:hypothetical protein
MPRSEVAQNLLDVVQKKPAGERQVVVQCLR